MDPHRTLSDFVALWDDLLHIAQLRLHLLNYGPQADSLGQRVIALRDALASQARGMDSLNRQIDQRDEQIRTLRKEYAALEKRQESEQKRATEAIERSTFRQLQPIAVQLPTLLHAIDSGAEVSAADALALFVHFSAMLKDQGYEAIGGVGELLPFDPALHRAVGKGARSVRAGDPVQVRYVGYQRNGEILVKADVILVDASAGGDA